jgi:hypothetical protein
MVKSKYISPQIEIIQLDKHISLALESPPPSGPDEFGFNNSSKVINPFDKSIG